jgi:hypothetical protein
VALAKAAAATHFIIQVLQPLCNGVSKAVQQDGHAKQQQESEPSKAICSVGSESVDLQMPWPLLCNSLVPLVAAVFLGAAAALAALREQQDLAAAIAVAWMLVLLSQVRSSYSIFALQNPMWIMCYSLCTVHTALLVNRLPGPGKQRSIILIQSTGSSLGLPRTW